MNATTIRVFGAIMATGACVLLLFSEDPGVPLLIACVGLAFVALGYWLTRIEPEFLAEITCESITIHRYANESSRIEWNQITSVTWPKSQSDQAHLEIEYRPEGQDPVLAEKTKVEDAVRDDRAKLYACIRIATPAADHVNWPLFCVRSARRLIKSNSDANLSLDDFSQLVETRSTDTVADGSFRRFIEWLLLPFAGLWRLAFVVSRATYWFVAAAIAVSGLVNIRLIWGHWAEPFTSYCAGAAAMFFILGCAAGPDKPKTPDGTELDGRVLGALLVGVIVGIPLLGNAAAKKWLPEEVARYAAMALFAGSFLGPCLWSERKREIFEIEESQTGSASLASWQAFENYVSENVFSPGDSDPGKDAAALPPEG